MLVRMHLRLLISAGWCSVMGVLPEGVQVFDCRPHKIPSTTYGSSLMVHPAGVAQKDTRTLNLNSIDGLLRCSPTG
jgi:hypothetical protein